MAWRPLDPGYEYHEQLASDAELETYLRAVRHLALRKEVREAVLRNKGDAERYAADLRRYASLGLIAETDDEDAILRKIDRSFDDFLTIGKRLPGKWLRHLYFEAAKWLVATEVIRLNTCRDWLVDRRSPAASVGIRQKGPEQIHYEVLEDLLAAKYGDGERRFFHLHSGSGDNSGVYAANKRRDVGTPGPEGRIKGDRRWRHVGFGNKLYASVETLIGQFLKPHLRDPQTMHPNDPETQIVLRVLTEALQKKLHERWHSPAAGVTETETWGEGDTEEDFNEVFRLLRNPKELLSEVNFPHAVSVHLATYELSGRFTGDSAVHVAAHHELVSTGGYATVNTEEAALRAYTTLMRLSGMSDALVEYERCAFIGKAAEQKYSAVNSALSSAKKFVRAEKRRGVAAEIRATFDRVRTHLSPAELEALGEQPSATLFCKTMETAVSRLKNDVEMLNGKPGSMGKIEEAEHALSQKDILERRIHTLRWVRAALAKELDRSAKPSRAIRRACEEMFGPPDRSTAITCGTLSDRVDMELSTLAVLPIRSVNPEESPGATETLETYFEPEFMATLREDPVTPLPTRWMLIDAAQMGDMKERRIDGIDPLAVVRADGMQVGEHEIAIPRTDFTIRRDETAVYVQYHGKPRETPADAPDVQTAFALEITRHLNLNERPYAYIRNFVPGDFSEICDESGGMFPQESIDLITAIRSDSHIPDEEFARLAGDYMRLLRPGGCIVTDGIEESYSQVLRLIASQPQQEFRVLVSMSQKTHRPIGLFIQRAHKNGYLTAKERHAVFDESVYFKSPEQIANLRPDLRIVNDVRQEIRAVEGHGAFAFLAGQIDLDRDGAPSRLEELITMAGAGRQLVNREELMTGSLVHSIIRHLLGKSAELLGNPRMEAFVRAQQGEFREIPDHHEGDNSDTTDPDRRVERDFLNTAPDVVRAARELAASFPGRNELTGLTVWGIRQKFVECLDPEEQGTRAIQTVEKAILAAVADEWVADSLDKTPWEVTQAERNAEEERMFLQARNIVIDESKKTVRYPEHPLLTGDDINALVRRTSARAIRSIQKGRAMIARQRLLRGDTDPSLPEAAEIRNTEGWIRHFRRKKNSSELPEFRTTILSDNREFTTSEAAERLRGKQEEILRLSQALQMETNHAPIGFIDFTDCVTNRMLLTRMWEIFGDDLSSLVDVVPCTFENRGGTPCIKEERSLRESIDEWGSLHNRLIIGGGSWTDAFDRHGAALKATLAGGPFMQAAGDRNVRLLGICYFSQILGDVLGYAHPSGKRQATTVPGALEIGFSRVTPTGEGKTHPLFDHCGACTVAMSRGGHLVGDGVHERGMLKTLARSGSGGTVAWEAMDGKILGIQFHPEVRCVDPGQAISNDVEQVLTQLSKAPYSDTIAATFDCDPQALRSNFDAKQADIRGNAGDEILANALLYQLRALSDHRM